MQHAVKGECVHTVRYFETDQMGIVHHANVIRWLETARIEYLKKLGINYLDIEKENVFAPVRKLEIKYITSAKFDDVVKIKTKITKITKFKIIFEQEISDKAEEVKYSLAYVEVVFVDKNGKLIKYDIEKKGAVIWKN